MPMTPPVLRLRSHLVALLVVAMLLSFALVLAGVLAYRVPRIEEATRLMQAHEVAEMRGRLEQLLQRYRSRLALLEMLVDDRMTDDANAVLDLGVGDGVMLRAIYRVSAQGRITAAGLAPPQRDQRADLLGNDLSANHLFRAVSHGPGVAWSVLYPSLLTGEPCVAVAVRDAHGDLLVAELPLATLVDAVKVASGGRASEIWVVDRRGELVSDSRGGQDIGRLNIRNWPLMQALLRGEPAAQRLVVDDALFAATVSHSPMLDWFFIGRVPLGWANPQVREAVLAACAALAGGLAIGLVIAPFWASRMARPLARIIERADLSASGEDAGLAWPRGSVAEFNRLSDDLQTLTGELHERERKSQAVFHASPVPMAVADMDDDYRLLDVNHAWCQEFLFRREEVLGRTTLDIGLWVDREAAAALRTRGERGETIGDVWLRRSDGTQVLMLLHGRMAVLPRAKLSVWAAMAVGPMRRAEQELRELNQQLEARVQRRTEALASSNAELTLHVEQLRAARQELVRAEKMAALGRLVAGVAHELNTPLDNGAMAVSAMGHAVQDFKAAMSQGVRRSALQQLMQDLEHGADIAGRNLRRAAELVHGFKQVAVDRTSAQRRSFELAEVVHEMVVSLQPSFARQPWRIDVAVPARGLRLDGYPGALGQTLGNLIQNAVLHGFDGRAHGTVRITAGRGEDGWIWLRVADDGHGIAAEHIDRIFDPFMTTRMGHGGTGLGLHICYNAVVNLLGGTLTVQSTPGQGACFELRLPEQAPDTPRGPGADDLRI